MLALSGRKKGKTKALRPSVVVEEAALVLPRPLRRVQRFIVALCTGKIYLPRHIGKLSLMAYCAAVGAIGVANGGYWSMVEETMTSTVGFAIENVKLSGNVHTSEIDVLQSLGLDGTTSLVAIDVDDARRKVAALPWVQQVEVRKVYPRTIEVNIKEREAYGIWQHGTELSLIEKNGSVIAPLRDNKFASLPLFVGRDAETAAQDVEKDFAGHADILQRVRAFVRVASRRWDVHLDNGVLVKLPEENISSALDRLTAMENEQKLLERDIVAVDLRLEDRMAVQLSPEAEQRRQAAVAARAKEIVKAEQRT